MSWRRRLLASLPLAAAGLWLTTAAASAQALGLPGGAPHPPASAPTAVQAVQAVKQTAQPAVHAVQQTAPKAAQPVTKTVDRATQQTNASVTSVARTVKETSQTAVAAAPAPVPSPPSVPPPPQIPPLSPAVDTLSEVVTDVISQVVAPVVAAVEDETDPPEVDAAPEPVAPPVVRAQVRLPAAQPAIAMPVSAVVPASTADGTTTLLVTDTATADDEEFLPGLEVSAELELPPPTERFIELNAVAAFPQPTLVAEVPTADASLAEPQAPLTAHVDTFEPLVPTDTTHSATNVDATPEPAAPRTTSLPASIGLPSTAAAGQLPSLTPLLAPDTLRGLWPHARRLPSVIVLPNLAPPG